MLLYAAVAATMLWTLAPAYWLLVSSLSTSAELFADPPHLFPHHPTLARLKAVVAGEGLRLYGQLISSPVNVFRRAFINSVTVAVSATALCLTLGSLSAYAVTRLRFPLRTPFFLISIAAQMLPPIALVIPLYQITRRLHLTDTAVALILVHASFLLVYVIWVMTSFFKSVPLSLEEAARIDGCTRVGALVRVTLPLSVPGLTATGLLSFLLSWDNFLYALILTNSTAAKTIPVAIGEFTTQFSQDYGMIATGGVVASLPPVLIALVFQRYLVRGLTAGAVRG